jgi:hypothetical protein
MQRAKLGPTPMQRGLDSAHRRVHDLRHFCQMVGASNPLARPFEGRGLTHLFGRAAALRFTRLRAQQPIFRGIESRSRKCRLGASEGGFFSLRRVSRSQTEELRDVRYFGESAQRRSSTS